MYQNYLYYYLELPVPLQEPNEAVESKDDRSASHGFGGNVNGTCQGATSL